MHYLFCNSSLIPLSKIANAPTRFIRVLWTTSFLFMISALSICIFLAVKQYLHHQTTFQTEIHTNVNSPYNKLPSVTFCPSQRHMLEAFKITWKRYREIYNWSIDGLPPDSEPSWINPFYRNSLLDAFKEYPRSILSYQVPSSNGLTWSSMTAASPFYRLFFNFTITAELEGAKGISLQVMEQLPRTKSFLCTTMVLNNSQSIDNSPLMNMVRFRIQFHPFNATPIPFSAIVHESHHFPFGAYEKYIHCELSAGQSVSVFYSKTVTKRLEKYDSHCVRSDDGIRLFGATFLREREVCFWEKCLLTAMETYQCAPEMDILSYGGLRQCNREETVNSCSPILPEEVCPPACTSFTYTSHNTINMPIKNKDSMELVLVKNSFSVAVSTEEEIYSLTKLLSEIGGLCSLFIGFSLIFIFELLEALIRWCQTNKHVRFRKESSANSQRIRSIFTNQSYRDEHLLFDNHLEYHPPSCCLDNSKCLKWRTSRSTTHNSLSQNNFSSTPCNSHEPIHSCHSQPPLATGDGTSPLMKLNVPHSKDDKFHLLQSNSMRHRPNDVAHPQIFRIGLRPRPAFHRSSPSVFSMCTTMESELEQYQKTMQESDHAKRLLLDVLRREDCSIEIRVIPDSRIQDVSHVNCSPGVQSGTTLIERVSGL